MIEKSKRFFVAAGSLRAEKVRSFDNQWSVLREMPNGMTNIGYVTKCGRNRWTGRFNYEKLRWYRGRSLTQCLRRMEATRKGVKHTKGIKTWTGHRVALRLVPTIKRDHLIAKLRAEGWYDLYVKGTPLHVGTIRKEHPWTDEVHWEGWCRTLEDEIFKGSGPVEVVERIAAKLKENRDGRL